MIEPAVALQEYVAFDVPVATAVNITVEPAGTLAVAGEIITEAGRIEPELLVTMNVTAFDEAPLVGSVADTETAPGVAVSLLDRFMSNSRVLTKVVSLFAPFNEATVELVKLSPASVRVMAREPACATAGSRDVMTSACALVFARRDVSALPEKVLQPKLLRMIMTKTTTSRIRCITMVMW